MAQTAALRRVFAVGLIFIMTVVTVPGFSSAHAAKCASSQDLAALEVRVLQTELMVAALTCGQQDKYNTFVKTYQSELVKQGRALRALFKRVYGSAHKKRLNGFVTKLANDSSQRSNGARQGYCMLATELFNEALLGRTAQSLKNVTDKPWIRTKHSFQPCSG